MDDGEYARAMRRADIEARYALVGIAAIVVVWCLAGFAVAPLGIYCAGMPLWVITGCVGTWLFAVCVAIVLVRRVIVDVDLDAVEPSAEGDAR